MLSWMAKVVLAMAPVILLAFITLCSNLKLVMGETWSGSFKFTLDSTKLIILASSVWIRFLTRSSLVKILELALFKCKNFKFPLYICINLLLIFLDFVFPVCFKALPPYI